MFWERGWFLNISAVSSLKELDHLKVDITYSVHTHTHAHISQNTLIQPTVGLNKFKCMLGKWSVCSAQHAGTAWRATRIRFHKIWHNKSRTYKLYGFLWRAAENCTSSRISGSGSWGAPSWVVLFLSHKSSSVGKWRVRQIWAGSEPAEVIKIWT